MLNRLDIFKLKENLKKIGVDIPEFFRKADIIITQINSMEAGINSLQKLEMVKDSSKIIKEVISGVIYKINPQINNIIDIENKKNSSHSWLLIHIGIVMQNLETEKGGLVNFLSNQKNLDSDITNCMKLYSYSSYVSSLLIELFFNPLREALMKYNETTDDFSIEGNKLKKDINLFWFYVYSNFFISSQIVGSLVDKKDAIPNIIRANMLKKSMNNPIQQNQGNMEDQNLNFNPEELFPQGIPIQEEESYVESLP